jgi:hypothetical protein
MIRDNLVRFFFVRNRGFNILSSQGDDTGEKTLLLVEDAEDLRTSLKIILE